MNFNIFDCKELLFSTFYTQKLLITACASINISKELYIGYGINCGDRKIIYGLHSLQYASV